MVFLFHIGANSSASHGICIDLSQGILTIFPGEPGTPDYKWNLARTFVLNAQCNCKKEFRNYNDVRHPQPTSNLFIYLI